MILCCGEALIDMLPRRSETGEAAFAPYAGGAVFNSAVALGRLGVPVEFFSGLSRDFLGEILQTTLRQSGTGTRYAHVSDRPTTLAFVRLVDGQASYLFYDEGTAGRMLSEADLPVLGDDVDAMLFGAISLIPEPCGSAYEALMRREHRRRVVMLDPNIRPLFIRDRDSHLARMNRMVAMSNIVKLSDEDIAWFGEPIAENLIARWLSDGPSIVLMTKGAKGAVAYTRAGRVEVASRSVTVVDTVGAGDTFNAGFLASLHDQKLMSRPSVAGLSEHQIRAALELGVAAAAVTVSRAGANPPWRRELA